MSETPDNVLERKPGATSKETDPTETTTKDTATAKAETVTIEGEVVEGQTTQTAQATKTTETKKTETDATDSTNNTTTETDNSTADTTADTETHEKNHDNEFKEGIETLKSRNWGNIFTRALFMVSFGFLGWLAITAAFTIAVINMIVYIIKDEPQRQLSHFTKSLGDYLEEIMDYLSLSTDEKPFPLGNDFPDQCDDDD